VEARLSKDQRALFSAEKHQDQLVKRNTLLLLLTVYQHIVKILRMDKMLVGGC